MQICTEAVPPLTEVASRQASACWLHASGLSTAERAPLKIADHAISEPPDLDPDDAAVPGEEA
jgi:hypothetical protein